ncbi:MAG: hypothetical protein ACJASQ_002509 [Crocinitomicaceae bacterium]|jgi:hypothetical protein
MSPISIHSNESQVHLQAMSYNVNILGGFYIEKNGFKLQLTNNKTGEIVKPTHSKWRVQSIHFRKRSKRCFDLNIVNSGEYKIEFFNSEKLIVKRSNLLLAMMFSNPIPNEEITIYIYRKN